MLTIHQQEGSTPLPACNSISESLDSYSSIPCHPGAQLIAAQVYQQRESLRTWSDPSAYMETLTDWNPFGAETRRGEICTMLQNSSCQFGSASKEHGLGKVMRRQAILPLVRRVYLSPPLLVRLVSRSSIYRILSPGWTIPLEHQMKIHP